MKIISDIRLFTSSETENHVGFGSKSLNIAVRRAVMKLREHRFSLGEFDHLYLNFTVCRPAGTIKLIDQTDRYHPWYRYCDIGLSQGEYDRLEMDDGADYVLRKIEDALLNLFCPEESAVKIVKESISEAKKGSEMLMRFKEKKFSKGIAAIYLRLLDNGNYFPLLCVYDLRGSEIFRADLPETMDLGIVGEIRASGKKVTINPRKNVITRLLELEPISFEFPFDTKLS